MVTTEFQAVPRLYSNMALYPIEDYSISACSLQKATASKL